jgi:argonaute-like protein implicated in RNA metabolism and viral defense
MCFGGNHDSPYDEKALLTNLHNFGLYKISDRFQREPTVRIGVINALGARDTTEFEARLDKELGLLGFSFHVVEDKKLVVVSRAELERAVESLTSHNPDLVLAFFPDEHSEDDEEWGGYHHFKSLTVGRGVPSQVVHESTIDNRYAMGNIVLGILGKTGNIPFAFADPLEYADLVVGIDIARRRKARLPGSINATAIARIYFGNGEFVRYVIHDAPLEGETVPENVLQGLFPIRDFEGKRVVVHRDGYFRGGERQALLAWARRIGATFHLVEVIKTGTPRLYGLEHDRTIQAAKGSTFLLSNNEGFLVSSLPPFWDATAQPLRIRSQPPFPIERAIDSVLSLTLLHYGSLRPPKLPVTIHYSDKMAYLALMGIKPKELEGRIPYWL